MKTDKQIFISKMLSLNRDDIFMSGNGLKYCISDLDNNEIEVYNLRSLSGPDLDTDDITAEFRTIRHTMALLKDSNNQEKLAKIRELYYKAEKNIQSALEALHKQESRLLELEDLDTRDISSEIAEKCNSKHKTLDKTDKEDPDSYFYDCRDCGLPFYLNKQHVKEIEEVD